MRLSCRKPSCATTKGAWAATWSGSCHAPGTPLASLSLCEQRPYLPTPEARELRTSADGRTRCILDQVAVAAQDGGAAPEPDASGWYYDDFSSPAVGQCGEASEQRVVFTEDVVTPGDVRVYVDCAAP